MDVLIIGVTGGIGRRLAQRLRSRGTTVRGLVRRDEQRGELAADDVVAHVGDPAVINVEQFAAAADGCDAIVHEAVRACGPLA